MTLPLRSNTINRGGQLIDTLKVNKDKLDLLYKEKTDVFLLYRGWLEMQRYAVIESIAKIKASARSQTITGQPELTGTANNSRSLINSAYQFLKTIDYKIDYLTTIDRGFVSQCLRKEYQYATNTLTAAEAYSSTFTRGNKFYELTDARGNVMAVVTDKKKQHSSNGTTIDYYEPDIAAATDYAPFGSPLPARNYQQDKYRYGFNGKENDNEVKGDGNQQDYGMRIYDPRLGRFLSEDPITKEYPWYTPYQFAGNTPIQAIDQDGLEPAYVYTPGEVNGTPVDYSKPTRVINAPAGDNLPRRIPPQHLQFLPSAPLSAGAKKMRLSEQLERKRSFSYKPAHPVARSKEQQATLNYAFKIIGDQQRAATNRAKLAEGDPMSDVPILGNVSQMFKRIGSGDYEGATLSGINVGVDATLTVYGPGLFKVSGSTVSEGSASSLVKSWQGSITNEGVTVIGEGMKRVEAFASKIPGAKILNDMPNFIGTKDQITGQMMFYNRQWILNEMRSGRAILDIGSDLNRINPSIFYQMEQNMLKNYQILHPNSLKIINP